MKIYIIPKEYVEQTQIQEGDFDGWWELPENGNGHKDYSVATGWVRAVWYQHIHHTAHVALTHKAGRRIEQALERGDHLVYRDGPKYCTNYILYTSTSSTCPHCTGAGRRLKMDS